MIIRKLVARILAVVLLAGGAWAQPQQRAPEFPSDLQFLDSAPDLTHSITDYRGKVLLIDIWEYTCINCIRDFAVLKRWYAKYHRDGFEVLGVHDAEFQEDYDPGKVSKAARRFRLPWPIAVDRNGAFWRAYHVTAWPERFLIDPDGNVVLTIEGEEHNDVMEARIRDLLARKHPEVEKIALDPAENTFVPKCGVPTDETMVGVEHGRGAVANPEPHPKGKVVNFQAKEQPKDGDVILGGRWREEADNVIAEDANDTAAMRYHARSLYAVLSNAKHAVRVDITQDGQPLTPATAGGDVKFEGAKSYVEVNELRMYDLVKNPAFGQHVLTFTPEGAGFVMFSFTFGNDCQQNVAVE